MESKLSKRDTRLGDMRTIAVISPYAYTHVADEGGFDLANYPSVQAWIKRIEALPKHISMEALVNAQTA